MQIVEDILVQLKKVSFAYNGEFAVKNIDLVIKRGDFLGIIGPNGSGKTTLLKIMLGLIQPQQGTVQLFGQQIHQFKNWSKIGYVPQKAGSNVINFPISVEEVVGMNGSSQNEITSALCEVEMIDHKKRLLRELSGGQQQRVLIARALVTRPELMILDEPTVGVDTDSQTKFFNLLKNLNRNFKLTLVLVSHDIEVVFQEVSEVACLNATLVYHGKPQDIINSEHLEKLYGKEVRFVVHEH